MFTKVNKGIILLIFIFIILSGCTTAIRSTKSSIENRKIQTKSDQTVIPKPIHIKAKKTQQNKTNTSQLTQTIRLSTVYFMNDNLGWMTEISRQTGSNKNLKLVLLQTNDGGITWDKVKDLSYYFEKLMFINNKEGFALANTSYWNINKTSDVILKTLDGGKTWKIVWKEEHHAISNLTMQFFGNTGYVFFESHFLITNDMGESWKEAPVPANIRISDFHFVTSKLGFLLAGSANAYIFLQTQDGGLHWKKIYQMKNLQRSGSISFTGRNDGWMLFGGNNCAMHGCMNQQLYHTSDGGKHWQKKQGDNFGAFPFQIHFQTKNEGWIFSNGGAATNGDIFSTHDGGNTWLPITSNLLGHHNKYSLGNFSSIQIYNSNKIWLTATSYKNGAWHTSLFRTSDGGNNWIILYDKKTNY